MSFWTGLQSREKPKAIRHGFSQGRKAFWDLTVSGLHVFPRKHKLYPYSSHWWAAGSIRTAVCNWGPSWEYLSKMVVSYHLDLLEMLKFTPAELLPCARPCGCTGGYGKRERNLRSLSLTCLQSKRRIKWGVNYETITPCSTNIHRSTALLVWTGTTIESPHLLCHLETRNLFTLDEPMSMHVLFQMALKVTRAVRLWRSHQSHQSTKCWCRMALSSSRSTPSQRQMGKLKPMLREVPSPRPQAEMFALLVQPLFCCISLPFMTKSSLYDRELFIMLVLRDMISTFAVGWYVRFGLWAAVTFRETPLNPEVIQTLW